MTISIHIYISIYTVINKYMSQSAPPPYLPPSKINHIPALSEFPLRRKLTITKKKSELNNRYQKVGTG